MRQIEKEMVVAIRGGYNFRSSNTDVVVCGDVRKVYLHNIHIATITRNSVEITNCKGWRSQTTKTRLNAILVSFCNNVYVTQHNWSWYYMTPQGKIDFEPRVFPRA